MTSLELAALCERAPGFDAETLRLLAHTLRTQADEIEVMHHMSVVQAGQVRTLLIEIDRLKAEAIVQGSLKLDEAVKQAKRREAVETAWERITSGRGWLGCVHAHDCRCDKDRKISETCTCGADGFRKLMDE